MKMEIISEKRNPAMKRDEHIISADHKGKATPSRPDIIKDVARLLKMKEDLIIVDKIINKKGIQSSLVYVLSYKKRDDIPEYKLEKMKKRIEKIKKEKPPEPKPVEAPKEEGAEETKDGEEKKEEPPEAPAEEKSDEAKEEPKEDKPAEEPKEEEKTEEKPAEEAKEEKKE